MGIAIDPSLGHIYVASTLPGRITVIDAESNRITETVELEGGVNSIAVNALSGLIYVTGEIVQVIAP